MAKKNNFSINDMDALFEKFMSNALYQSENKSVERELDNAAKVTKDMFDSYVRAGFTEEQAMTLIATIIVGGSKKDEQ